MSKSRDIEFIKDRLLKISNFVKKVHLYIDENGYHVYIYPNFRTLKEKNIINIREEIKWYAVELYNLEVSDERKIKSFEIVYEKNDEELIVNSIKDEIYTRLYDFLRSLTTKEISCLSHLELDLELDSLNYVELFNFVEQSFGVYMDEKIFSQYMRFDDLYKYLLKKRKFVKSAKIEIQEIVKKPVEKKLLYSPIIMSLYKIVFYPLFRLYFRLDLSGLENIPKGSCIIAPSHQSMLDGFLIEATLPFKILKKSFFLAFKQVFGTKILEPVAKHGQSILIDANENLEHSIIYSSLPLRENANLVIFPEGARTRDRELLEFKKFFAILSKSYNVPVVPVVIDGSFEALKSGTLFPKPKKIKVTYLEAIYPDGLSYEEITSKTKNAIEEEMKNNPVLR